MPAPGSSAKRYAQAVFEIAQEHNRLEEWQQELQTIAQAVEQPEFVSLLSNPRLPVGAKRQVLQETLVGASEQAVNLATLLVVSGRLEALAGPIAQEYAKRLDELRGIVRVEVITAVGLDRAQREEISRRLVEATGKEIRMEERIEPDIMGGLVIRIGDQVVDGSLRSKLRGLKRSLAEVLV